MDLFRRWVEVALTQYVAASHVARARETRLTASVICGRGNLDAAARASLGGYNPLRPPAGGLAATGERGGGEKIWSCG